MNTTNSSSPAALGAVPPYPAAPEPDPIGALRHSMLQTLRRNGWSTLKYLGTTEVHTYAFSVAANAILSFMPAAVLMRSISLQVLHSRNLANAVLEMIKAFLPTDAGTQLKIAGWVTAQSSGHAIELFSLIMLFVSCTGVFEPLEVALNSVWGFKSRNYLMNQAVSLGIALCCGVLAFLSAVATAGIWAPTSRAQAWLVGHVGEGFISHSIDFVNTTLQHVVLKSFGLAAAIMIFFLIYWLLPNGKIKPSAVLPSAIITGFAFEFAQVIFMAVVPYLDFKGTYGNFAISVTLIFWAFFVGLLLLGGAHLSAQDLKTSQKLSLMTKPEDAAPQNPAPQN